MKNTYVTNVFIDVGNVLLNDGWGHEARNNAVAHFKLNSNEITVRNNLLYYLCEEGRLTLDDYVQRVIFYEERSFSPHQFIKFMFKQSYAYRDALDFFAAIKKRYNLKYTAVSNECRELNTYRIKEFKLDTLFDDFVSSAFVHVRKPDAEIFSIALDISMAMPEHTIYIDDMPVFVEIAKGMGMHGVHYTGLEDTKIKLKAFGLTLE